MNITIDDGHIKSIVVYSVMLGQQYNSVQRVNMKMLKVERPSERRYTKMSREKS
jgi:hypothetical protein